MPELVFAVDAYMISRSDLVIVYLSDDISVGGSQEILIAKYFGKPVIGLALFGGKFNGSQKEMFGRVIDNHQDPFVFTTCDIVCDSIEAVAAALKDTEQIKPKRLDMIDNLIDKHQASFLAASDYLRHL